MAQTVAAATASVQNSVDAAVASAANIAGALGGRTIAPPVRFDIGFSTAGMIDEPVVGFGDDDIGGTASTPPPPSSDQR